MRKYGLEDEGIVEVLAVVDLLSGYNKLMDGHEVEPDEKAVVRMRCAGEVAVSDPQVTISHQARHLETADRG